MSKPTTSEFSKTGARIHCVGRLVDCVAYIAATPTTQRKLPVDHPTRFYRGN